MFTLQTKIEILLDVLVAGVFVASFYFTVSKDLEEKSVTRNVTDMVDSIIPQLNWKTSTVGQKIQPIVCDGLAQVNITSPQALRDDEAVEEHNAGLIKKSVKSFGSIVVVGLLIALYLYSQRSALQPVNLKEVLIHCVVMLITIAAAEYYFFKTTVGNAVFADVGDIVSILAGR